MLCLEPFLKDRCLEIALLKRDYRIEAMEFLEKLAKDNPNTSKGLKALFDSFAKQGTPLINNTRFRQVRANLFEIRYDIRLFCFFNPPEEKKLLIITHGWSKGPKKEQSQQIERAARLRDDYFSQNAEQITKGRG